MMNKRTFALALHMPTLLEAMRHHDLNTMVSIIIAEKFQVYLYQWDTQITMSFLEQYVSVYVECTNYVEKPSMFDKPDWNYLCDPFPALDNFIELTQYDIEKEN